MVWKGTARTLATPLRVRQGVVAALRGIDALRRCVLTVRAFARRSSSTAASALDECKYDDCAEPPEYVARRAARSTWNLTAIRPGVVRTHALVDNKDPTIDTPSRPGRSPLVVLHCDVENAQGMPAESGAGADRDAARIEQRAVRDREVPRPERQDADRPAGLAWIAAQRHEREAPWPLDVWIERAVRTHPLIRGNRCPAVEGEVVLNSGGARTGPRVPLGQWPRRERALTRRTGRR